MDYIEEKYASGRTTGQIKIHQKEDFQGMRKVGKLAAELLDLFVKKVEPGVTTESLDKFGIKEDAEIVSKKEGVNGQEFQTKMVH